MRLQSVMGLTDSIFARDALPAGYSGADRLRPRPTPPTPPAGVMNWNYMSWTLYGLSQMSRLEIVEMVQKMPQQLATDPYFRQLGATNVKSYGRILQRSWNWWIKQPFLRLQLANAHPRERADIIGKLNEFIYLVINS